MSPGVPWRWWTWNEERVAIAEAHLTDEAGKLYRHATTKCVIFRGNSPSIGEDG